MIEVTHQHDSRGCGDKLYMTHGQNCESIGEDLFNTLATCIREDASNQWIGQRNADQRGANFVRQDSQVVHVEYIFKSVVDG